MEPGTREGNTSYVQRLDSDYAEETSEYTRAFDALNRCQFASWLLDVPFG